MVSITLVAYDFVLIGPTGDTPSHRINITIHPRPQRLCFRNNCEHFPFFIVYFLGFFLRKCVIRFSCFDLERVIGDVTQNIILHHLFDARRNKRSKALERISNRGEEIIRHVSKKIVLSRKLQQKRGDLDVTWREITTTYVITRELWKRL